MKTAAWFITVACVIQVLGFLYALPGHLGDPTWSAHAQFHHVLGWFWILGLDLTIMALAWGPLQRQERWSFWSLVAAFIFAQGGYFFSMLLVPAGQPPELWFHLALGMNLLIFATGLVFGWRVLNARVQSIA
jgi:hypothetical protein